MDLARKRNPKPCVFKDEAHEKVKYPLLSGRRRVGPVGDVVEAVVGVTWRREAFL